MRPVNIINLDGKLMEFDVTILHRHKYINTISVYIYDVHIFISEVCIYKGVKYSQGQTWDDGCQYKCRCDDADKGLYTCNER